MSVNSDLGTIDKSVYCLQRAALAGSPDILVSTPGCIRKCLTSGVLQPASLNESLEILVLDEVRINS